MLHPPLISTERGKVSHQDFVEVRVKHIDPIKLTKESWCLMYSEQDYQRAELCRKMMTETCPKMGIIVEDPEFI